ncbi:MAG: hypothetical protein LBE12_01005 [Planctomycetaceae bacterium]|nr:hypothetical protein [Planctomycetaceae bacterium]
MRHYPLSTFHSQLLFCPYRVWVLVFYICYVGRCSALMLGSLSGRF